MNRKATCLALILAGLLFKLSVGQSDAIFRSTKPSAIIHLYSEAAPKSESWDWKERVSEPKSGLHMVHDVVRPVLLHYPADKSKSVGSAMIVAPGGGFRVLMMSYEGVDIAHQLNEMGIDAFVLKYRLLYTGPGAPPTAQMKLDDVNSRLTVIGGYEGQTGQDIRTLASADGTQAMRVIRDRATELGISKNRIGMIGFSAGGMVTWDVLNGDLESRPDFAAIIYGPTEPQDIPNPAPALFIAASADDALVVDRNLELFRNYRKANGPAELHIFQIGAHGFLTKGGGADHFMDRLQEWLAANRMLSRTNN